jgi:5-carboxymethyl-2-hydroxymuconate isomerase
MQGRSIEQKLNLSKTIVGNLTLMFPLVPNIGTNVIEFEKTTYFNRNMLDPTYEFSMP